MMTKMIKVTRLLKTEARRIDLVPKISRIREIIMYINPVGRSSTLAGRILFLCQNQELS